MDLTDLKYHPEKSIFEVDTEEILTWAHPKEPLYEHVNKTELVFNKYIDKNLIEQFYEYFKANNYLTIEYKIFEELLYKLVYFHDAAKISFNFQLKRLKNIQVLKILKKHDLDKFIDLIEINHSYVSSLLYFSFLTDKIDLKINIMTLLFPYIIYGHHTSVKDILNQEEFVWAENELSEETFCLFSKYYFEKEPDSIDFDIYKDFQEIFYKFLAEHPDPVISFFYSYLYSLLVTSDVIASSYANKSMNSVKDCSEKWNNRIKPMMKDSIEFNFNNLPYNKQCANVFATDLLSEEQIRLLEDINDLRTEMLKEASLNLTTTLNSDKNKRIFYLNMPTGGGKTNTSMKLAIETLKISDVNRIIYAMPFINIIEQNYNIIKNNFGLSEEKGEIRKIYSASETFFPEGSAEDKSEIIMKDDFFDYPVICTTFVSLFNSIIKNKKRYKYSLQSLTNSVIILDEIQSLPLKNWTSLYYLINEISKNYNIYFIIMSATLPKFDELKISEKVKFNYETVNLINKPEKYFSHPLFNRTEINGNITELDGDGSSDFHEYFESILKENFQKGFTKGLIVLNTIKISKRVYNCLNKLKKEHGFDIDLLNSTIIPSEKRKIIYKISKVKEGDRYLLISTQSIEAGVDVSFDFVVRDFATLDSIEQVRGRCNRSRELNKRFEDEHVKGNTYIVNIKRKDRFDHQFIYDKEELDVKIKETQHTLEKILNYNYEDVLDYYKAVSRNVNQIHDDKEKDFVFMDRYNLKCWNKLKYSDLMDKDYGIQIIQNNNIQYSFFVATEIKILTIEKSFNNNTIESMTSEEFFELYKNNKEQFVFTSNEINYLKNYERKYNVHIIQNNSINGSELIKCYGNYIKKFEKDFGAKKIVQKEFSSILYKFIFQVTGDKHEDLVETQGFDKVGYFYVIPEKMIGEGKDKVYSLKNGFNFDFMEENDDFNFV